VIEDWVEQCRNGQTRSFALIVTALQDKIVEFLYRMTRNREAAEDLGQEVFLRAYRLLDRYDRKKAAFSTWLFTLARNLCLDELRKKRPLWVNLEDAAMAETSSDPDPHLQARDAELEQMIATAVATLDPIFREVFILRDYQHLSFEEVAEITGCPVGTVKSRLHRARLLLQDKLTPALNA
jgi:RNA polymerase sigma-70 factor (ECF subfamily)